MSHPSNSPKIYSFIDDPWGWLTADDGADDSISHHHGKTSSNTSDDAAVSAVNEDNGDGGGESSSLESAPSSSSSSSRPRWRQLSCDGDHRRPKGRCSHSLTSIGNCCVILFGGGHIPSPSPPVDVNNDDDDEEQQFTNNRHGSSFHHFNDVWLFNGVTQQWKELQVSASSSKPRPRRGHVTQYSPDLDALIVFGGMTDNDELLNDLWILNLITLCWERIQEPSSSSSSAQQQCWPSPRRGHLSFVLQNKFYLLGGETNNREEDRMPLTPDIFEFDFNKASRYWTKCIISNRIMEGLQDPIIYGGIVSILQTRNIMHTPSIFVRNSDNNPTLYAFGGIIGRMTHPFIFKYSLITNSSSSSNGDGDGRTATFQESCVLNHGRRLENVGNLFEIAFTGNTELSIPSARYFHAGCPIEGVGNSGLNGFIISGGVGPDGNNVSDSYIYHTRTNTWSKIVDDNNDDDNESPQQSNCPGPRNGLCMAPLVYGAKSCGVLLFGGGEFQGEYYNDTYVLELGITSREPWRNSNTTTSVTTKGCDATTQLHQEDNNLTAVELVIPNVTEDDLSSFISEMSYVEILSEHSEYFQRMFNGHFLEAQNNNINNKKNKIQLSNVDPKAASVCLQYMRDISSSNSRRSKTENDSCRQDEIRSKLQGLELQELDSIVVVADFWGMYSFLNILQEVLYNKVVTGKHNYDDGDDDAIDELGLFEYAKSHGFHKLAMKCLRRMKFQHGTTIPNDYKVRVDPILLQEVQYFLETSLLV